VFDRSSPRDRAECMCVYCGEPLPFTRKGVEALRVGDKFVCNEFCADGISPGISNSQPQSNESAYRRLNWVYPTD
jgi:hypothetical protein